MIQVRELAKLTPAELAILMRRAEIVTPGAA